MRSISLKVTLRSNPGYVEANGGGKTPVNVTEGDAERRNGVSHAAATGTSTKWPPNGGAPARGDASFTLGGHFVEVFLAAA